MLKIIPARPGGVGSATVPSSLPPSPSSRTAKARERTAFIGRCAHLAAAAALLVLVAPGAAQADPSTTSPEQGYDQGEIPSPRTLAFGGAQNALGASTTALYGNPANLPLTRVYHFEGIAALSPQARRQTYGGAVVDSSTSRVAGGVGGTWSVLDPDGIHRTWTDLRLVLAYPLGDRFSVGATGRYLRASQATSTGPLGASLASDGHGDASLYNAVTFDVGATAIPADGLRIGVVGHNLTNPGTALAPTMVAGGIGYATASGVVSIEGDAQADFTTWKSARGRYMLGGEVFLAGHFPIRLGYRYDDGYKTHAVSGGLGYVERRWSFEVSVRQDVAGQLPQTVVVAGLRFFYDAASSGESDTPDNF